MLRKPSGYENGKSGSKSSKGNQPLRVWPLKPGRVGWRGGAAGSPYEATWRHGILFAPEQAGTGATGRGSCFTPPFQGRLLDLEPRKMMTGNLRLSSTHSQVPD